MTDLAIGFSMLGLLIIFVAMGTPMALVLSSLAFLGIFLAIGDFGYALTFLGNGAFNAISSYVYSLVPMFVLMGVLVHTARVGQDIFDISNRLVGRLPGSLGIATITSNAVFAAVTGISVASAAVFTKVAVPEMVRHGYRISFSTGAVAGSSVLGMLIPPSLLLIVFGVLAEVPIGPLFLAGIVPGLVLASAFCAIVILQAKALPHTVYGESMRPSHSRGRAGPPIFLRSIPVLTLIIAVLGGMYLGVLTPNEAGAVGAIIALIIFVGRRHITRGQFGSVLKETSQVTAGVLFLLLSAGLFSRMLAFLGVPQFLADLIITLDASYLQFVVIYLSLIVIMGMFLDPVSILLILVPIAVPIWAALGGDLIHLGIVTIIAVEMGLLTPPFGLSVFVVKASLQSETVQLRDIFLGTTPYLLSMLGLVILMVALPGFLIVSW